jgi:hypothetical protein
MVATMVLNDEIDLDKAKSYSNIARNVIQGMGQEVTKSRFLKTAADLSFADEADDFDATYEDE